MHLVFSTMAVCAKYAHQKLFSELQNWFAAISIQRDNLASSQERNSIFPCLSCKNLKLDL